MWVPEFSLDWTIPEAPGRISPVGFRQLLDVLRRGPQSRHCVLRSGRGEASQGRHGGRWGYRDLSSLLLSGFLCHRKHVNE